MTLLLFGLFFLFMLLGVPIAFAIGASTLYALYQSGVPLMVVTQQMFQGINSFALVAIPMFILAGDLMAQGKVRFCTKSWLASNGRCTPRIPSP